MSEAARSWYLLARSFDYVGTTLFLGGMAFVAFLWPDGANTARVRRLLGFGWLCGFAGTVAGLCFQAAWVAGKGPELSWPVVEPVLHSPFGRVWVARTLLWVLALVVLIDLSRRGRTAARSLAWRVGAIAVGLGVLRTNGMTGHALDLPGWGQVVVFVHLLVVCVWVGGLAVLLLAVLPSRDRDVLTDVLPRYSKLAMFSVATITAAGALLAWRLVGSLDALLHTGYGRTLLLKLVIFAAMLLAGLASKTWVDRRLAVATTARGITLSVAFETVLAVVVLGVAAFLVTTAPGR
ncbi:copper resistance protein [Lentzea sp. NBRC 105346]|uniref:CopD family protein n=1 Tax=Lentzea sp. NBRC 105346 TaxID=3032205 RepID=UPI0024A47EA5|nr:CopD family protein [Lentzea sp. NBRC 105346]GLZ33132.1 copper resistance protein [Lentzea sp. NBRC 105346]